MVADDMTALHGIRCIGMRSNPNLARRCTDIGQDDSDRGCGYDAEKTASAASHRPRGEPDDIDGFLTAGP